MKPYSKSILFFSCLAFVLLSMSAFKLQETVEVDLTNPPRNGFQVGRDLLTTGTLSVKPEQHVWVFVRRENFKPLWYPQGEANVDVEGENWYKNVYFGTLQDIGHKFDVAVAVFDEKEHLKLTEYWEKAMRTGEWLPIKMPPTVAPPATRKVLKVSH